MNRWRSRWAAVGAAVAVTLGAGGLVSVSAETDAPSVFVSVDPSRVLDTRFGVGLSGQFAGGTSRKLRVTGTVAVALPDGGTGSATVVPTGATAIVANLTAVRPSGKGYVSIRPGDATGTPSTSSLNVTAGEVFPNAVTVKLDSQGRVNLFYSAEGATTDLLLDIVGYYLDGGAAPGPEGPPGPPGPPGQSGAPGAEGVVSRHAFAGDIQLIAGGATGYQFVGETVSLTVDGAPSVVGAASLVLGTSVAKANAVRIGLCYQLGNGAIENFVRGSYTAVDVDSIRTAQSVSASYGPLAAGTYTMGACVWNEGNVTLNNNDYVNGWFLLVNG